MLCLDPRSGRGLIYSVITVHEGSGEGYVFGRVYPSDILSAGKGRTPLNTFKFVHFEARTVEQRAVGIRLKYLLVMQSVIAPEVKRYVFS